MTRAAEFIAMGAAAGAALGGAIYAAIEPQNQLWGKVVYRGNAAGPPRIALTFDDGPTDGATDGVLDALGDENTKATFFVIGVNLRRSPKLVERMLREGHSVQNHSLNHSHYGIFRGPRYWRQQIAETAAQIEQITGTRPAMFRPPMGVKQRFICAAANQQQHSTVTWSVKGRDGVETTRQQIIDRVVPTCRAGDIIMLHDGVEPQGRRNPAETVAAVKPIIRGIRARGIQIVSLSELTGLPPIVPATSS